VDQGGLWPPKSSKNPKKRGKKGKDLKRTKKILGGHNNPLAALIFSSSGDFKMGDT